MGGAGARKKVDKKMASIDGEMFCFHEENKNLELLAFVSQVTCHAFILLGGLGDGFRHVTQLHVVILKCSLQHGKG